MGDEILSILRDELTSDKRFMAIFGERIIGHEDKIGALVSDDAGPRIHHV